MKILIVDDIEETCEYIAKVIEEKHNDFICHTSFSYENALELLNQNKYDIIILDYELDKSDSQKNGLALGKYILQSSSHKNTPVVFATSYPEHIYTAVNMLNCAYYMIKPFYKENILDMLNKILALNVAPVKLTFHNSVGIHTLIDVSDIICISSIRHDIIVVTKKQNYDFTNYSLADIERDSNGQLLRCHKSYIINPNFISNIDRSNSYIHLAYEDKKAKVPVGRKYSEKIYSYCTL